MKTLFFDIETTPIAPMATDFPEFVAMGWRKETGFQHHTDWQRCSSLIAQAIAENYLLVGHNLAFDLGVLGFTNKELDRARIHDTMVIDMYQRLAKHDCSREKPGPPRLSKLVDLAPGLKGKGTVQLTFRPGQVLTPQQIEYLRGDIECLPKIMERQRREEIPGGYQLVTRQVQANLALMRLGFTGLRVDRAEISRQRAVFSKERRKAARVLQEHDAYRPARTGPKGGRYKASINTKVIKEHVVGLCTEHDIKLAKTDKGSIKTDKAFLSGLPQTDIIHNYLEYKNYEKLINTFLDAWDTEHGRIYPRYRGMMRTGRTSSHGPNLQQVPSRGKKGELKRVFLPEEGRQFYELDFGQIELCALAELTQGTMKRLINEDRDLHVFMASIYFGKEEAEVTKEERQLMKCFHPDVEFLTPDGWYTFDNLDGRRILQAEPIPGGEPVLSWTRPFNLFSKQAEELVHVKGSAMDIMVTPDHRMLCETTQKNPVVCVPEEMSTRRSVFGAGFLSSYLSCDESLLRLAVATAADGTFNGRKITFGFSKKRKVKRLKKLCESAGYRISQRTAENGVIHLRLGRELSEKIKRYLDTDKTFKWDWLLFSISARRAIVDEVKYWDSHVISSDSFSFSGTSRKNIDVLAAVAVSSGFRAHEFPPQARSNPNHKPCFKLVIYNRTRSRADSIKTKRIKYNGRVVCLSVPSSFVVVRSHGTIGIYGQCANYGLPGGMGQEKFRQFIRSNGLPDPGERAAADLKNAWLAAFPEMEEWLKDEGHFSVGVRRMILGRQEMTPYGLSKVGDRYEELMGEGRYIPQYIVRAAEEDKWEERGYSILKWLEHDHVKIRRGHVRRPVSYTEKRNTRFQGLTALLCKRALCKVMDLPDVVVNAFVHDSVLISCCDEGAVEAAGEAMLDAAKEYLPTVRVTVEICGPGDNWYEAKTAPPRTIWRK